MIRLWHRNREPSEATLSREEAEQALAATRAETAKYAATARRLLQIQEVNHLGQTAARVLRGEKP
jgi:hypothetical protein